MKYRIDEINIGDEVSFESSPKRSNLDRTWKVIQKDKHTSKLTIQLDEVEGADEIIPISIDEVTEHFPKQQPIQRQYVIEVDSDANIDRSKCMVDGVRIDEETIQFGGWIVKSNGEMTHTQTGTYITSDLLIDNDCILHYGEKSWVNLNEFIPAYFQALKNINVRELTVRTYY